MNTPRILLTLAVLTAASSSQALTAGTVTTTADAGVGSLRAAISAAANGETITFAPSLNGATITLTSGELVITGLQLSIDASALPAGISVSGNRLHRVFLILGELSNVALHNLKICNGFAGLSSGGGIFLAAGNLNLIDCEVKDNSATYNGGGIFLALSVTSSHDRCSFTGNSTGNLGAGGAVFVSGASTTLFRNCVVSGNASPFSGGLWIDNSSPILRNCTIQGNLGGGIRTSSNPVIQNSIIWGNVATSGNAASQQIKTSSGASPGVSYSLVQGAASSASFADGNLVSWGLGNLNGLTTIDPKFATGLPAGAAPHAGGDLRLLKASPALDQGNNSLDSGVLDLTGSNRIQNLVIDLGANEGYFVRFSMVHPSLDPQGDDNFNGASNFQEYTQGLDPVSTATSELQPTMSFVAGNKFLTYSHRPNGLDFSPLLVTSTDLASWAPMVTGLHYSIESSTSVSPDRHAISLRLISPEPTRFYRQGFIIQD